MFVLGLGLRVRLDLGTWLVIFREVFILSTNECDKKSNNTKTNNNKITTTKKNICKESN